MTPTKYKSNCANQYSVQKPAKVKKKIKAFDTIVQDRSAIISACLRKTLFGFGGGKKQKFKKKTHISLRSVAKLLHDN